MRMWFQKKQSNLTSEEYKILTNLMESMQTRIELMDTSIKSLRGTVNRKLARETQEPEQDYSLSEADKEFIQGLNPQERDQIMEKIKNAGDLQ